VIELPLVFLAGILGTAHCLGMCGPLALRLTAQSASWSHALARQSLYSLGRIFTYTFLGLLAGFAGQWAARHSAALINVPATLAIVAGLFLIWKGLQETGVSTAVRSWFARHRSARIPVSSPAPTQPARGTCGAGLLFAPFFRGQGHTGALLAGVCTGFLPCGLLYGMLTLAASTQQALLGGLVMLVFGLGTAPLMMLVGSSGQLLTFAFRRRLFAAAAWCLLLTGVISVTRGASHLSWGERPAPRCPFCAEAPAVPPAAVP
jgi:sulfite exporter TauE/SafE